MNRPDDDLKQLCTSLELKRIGHVLETRTRLRLIFGYVYLKGRAGRPNLLGNFQLRYREWKLARTREKFRAYVQGRDQDRDCRVDP